MHRTEALIRGAMGIALLACLLPRAAVAISEPGPYFGFSGVNGFGALVAWEDEFFGGDVAGGDGSSHAVSIPPGGTLPVGFADVDTTVPVGSSPEFELGAVAIGGIFLPSTTLVMAYDTWTATDPLCGVAYPCWMDVGVGIEGSVDLFSPSSGIEWVARLTVYEGTATGASYSDLGSGSLPAFFVGVGTHSVFDQLELFTVPLVGNEPVRVQVSLWIESFGMAVANFRDTVTMSASASTPVHSAAVPEPSGLCLLAAAAGMGASLGRRCRR